MSSQITESQNKPPLCIDCKWIRRLGRHAHCGRIIDHMRSPVTGEMDLILNELCRVERIDDYRCGPEGKFWEPNPPAPTVEIKPRSSLARILCRLGIHRMVTVDQHLTTQTIHCILCDTTWTEPAGL